MEFSESPTVVTLAGVMREGGDEAGSREVRGRVFCFVLKKKT